MILGDPVGPTAITRALTKRQDQHEQQQCDEQSQRLE